MHLRLHLHLRLSLCLCVCLRVSVSVWCCVVLVLCWVVLLLCCVCECMWCGRGVVSVVWCVVLCCCVVVVVCCVCGAARWKKWKKLHKAKAGFTACFFVWDEVMTIHQKQVRTQIPGLNIQFYHDVFCARGEVAFCEAMRCSRVMFLTRAVMLMVRPLATAMDNLTLSGFCIYCLQWKDRGTSSFFSFHFNVQQMTKWDAPLSG